MPKAVRVNLIKERKDRQWSQQKLADQLETTRNNVGRWELGLTTPSPFFRAKLCELFNKSAQELGLLSGQTGGQQSNDALIHDALDTPDKSGSTVEQKVHLWYVPSQRNPFFCGREETLHFLHAKLNQGCTLALTQSWAISGLGGIGKTQIALEYVYRYASAYTAIMWVGAETHETLLTSCSSLAEVLNLPERDAQDQHKISRAVTRWFDSHQGWLLIFDNVEDLTLLQAFLPTSRQGSILLTTRLQALGTFAQQITVDPLNAEEGMIFLLQRAKLLQLGTLPTHLPSADVLVAQELVEIMDGLPLALDQAGAYIEETQCSLSDYLNLFQVSQLRLLSERDAHVEHPLSVARTFALAFEQLERNNPVAAELLTVCSFLAPEAIPEMFFLEGASSLGQAFTEMASDPLVFQAAIKALLSYSLLQRDTTTHTLTVHRLVQAVLRERLSEAMRRSWVMRILLTMVRLFPDEQTHPHYDQLCAHLLPHALVCIALNEQQNEEVCIVLIKCVALYLTHRARYAEAESLLQQALSLGEWKLGPTHSIVAEVLAKQAHLFRETGRYAEAEPLFQQALCIWEQQAEPNYLEMTLALSSLALLYKEQGKYGEAELLFQRVLRLREQHLGSEHSLVAAVLNNLAILTYERGRYEEAEPLFQRALDIWEQQKHSMSAYALNGLANLYRNRGRYEEAEPLFQRALDIWEQQMGPEHTLVAHVLNNLANLFYDQGKYEEAEAFYQRALGIWEQQMGSNHPLVAYPCIGLANLYRDHGKYEEAEEFYQQAQRIWEGQLEPEHLLMAHLFSGLAELYRVQGKYVQAEPLYEKALHIREQLEPTHPDTAETLYGLAALREAQGRYQEAILVYQRVLHCREQSLGLRHPKTQEAHKKYFSLLNSKDYNNEINR